MSKIDTNSGELCCHVTALICSKMTVPNRFLFFLGYVLELLMPVNVNGDR